MLPRPPHCRVCYDPHCTVVTCAAVNDRSLTAAAGQLAPHGPRGGGLLGTWVAWRRSVCAWFDAASLPGSLAGPAGTGSPKTRSGHQHSSNVALAKHTIARASASAPAPLVYTCWTGIPVAMAKAKTMCLLFLALVVGAQATEIANAGAPHLSAILIVCRAAVLAYLQRFDWALNAYPVAAFEKEKHFWR